MLLVDKRESTRQVCVGPIVQARHATVTATLPSRSLETAVGHGWLRPECSDHCRESPECTDDCGQPYRNGSMTRLPHGCVESV